MKCSHPLKALLSCKTLPPGHGQVGTKAQQEPEVCGFDSMQPFGYCWANRGRNSPTNALSGTPKQASSHCGFGSNPPRKSVWPGCEIILPSHCMCSATLPDVRALPSALQAVWMARGGHRDLRAGSSPEPLLIPESGVWPGAWNRGKCHTSLCWPLQAEAGSKPLTLELTGFVAGVVGDGHD